MNIKDAIGRITHHLDLSRDEMKAVIEQIMTGGATQAQIGAFLIALRMKGESVDEITGAAEVMRQLATKVQINAQHLVDIVGTGGDGASLFNVSTASSFVVAAAGASVAKHGNRSISSNSGSADLLQQAGINLNLTAEQVRQCVEQLGIGFLFAPHHHAAMKYAIGPRKELGIRTFMNILGPITNPADTPNLVIGVFTAELCRPMAEVLHRLGNQHVMVVYGLDGLDEISLAGDTQVAELKDGQVCEYTLRPEMLGIESQSLTGLQVDSAAASLTLIQDALGKQAGQFAQKAAAMIALNAGAALYVSGVASSLKEGVAMARKVISNGLALDKMQQLAKFTNAFTAAEHQGCPE